jgi:two-component system, OmpR family, response regulator
VRVLVVEDEPGIADLLRRALVGDGHAVDLAADGTEGEALALSGEHDLVILDRRLPGMDGIAVLESLRRSLPETPVIMLTALGEREDVIAGLDSGADDYITKPFDLEELLARVRAQLRRPTARTSSKLVAGDIELDPTTRNVLRAGQPVQLTTREFQLLAYLVRRPNEVLSREQILKAVWGYDHDPGTNVLAVYIAYLRRKLTIDGDPPPIETVRSAGFRLVVPGDG